MSAFKERACVTQTRDAARRVLRSGCLVALAAGLATVSQFALAEEVADPTFLPNGVGVISGLPGVQVPEQINQDPAPLGGSEALVVDLGASAYQVSITVSNLFKSENGCAEVGRWTAFSSAGIQVGTGLMYDGTLNYGVSTNVGTLSSPLAGPMQYIAFGAEPYGAIGNPTSPCATASATDSSDYLVRQITFKTKDADGNLVDGTPLGSSGTVPPDVPWEAPLYGYTSDDSFVDDSGLLIKPDGTRLGEIVISDIECSAEGDNNTDCVIQYTPEFKTIINGGDVEGKIRLVGVHNILDPRPLCDPLDTVTAAEEAASLATIEGLKLNLGYAVNMDGDGNNVPGPVIPAHLCGIPDPLTGKPTIVVVEIDGSDLRVSSSVLKHVANDPDNTAYVCPSNNFAGFPQENRDNLPVMGWLPRVGEMPVFDAMGQPSYELEDVTFACGSYRGGSSTKSFFVYNLHHKDATTTLEYRVIIDSDIAQLRTTVSQTRGCVSNGTQTSAVESMVDKADKWFDTRQFAKAKAEFINIRKVVNSPTSAIGLQFPYCFVDEGYNVVRADPSNPDNLVPRNFRGDLLVRVDHILYMMEATLGVLTPARPIPPN